jgi:Icc-related predicted phosphoesterase
MKVIAIGDIHGRQVWKDIVTNNSYDKVIFLGDYHDIYDEFDTEYLTAKQNSIENLKNIINFKKENPDKVILLIGNHDIHYLHDIAGCSRFDWDNAKKVIDIFEENSNLFQCAYKIENYLFTHAGVSTMWAEYYEEIRTKINTELPKLKDDHSNIDEVINTLYNTPKGIRVLNMISYFRGGGSSFGGPLWTDLREVYTMFNCNIIKGIHQIVGHTRVKKIVTKEYDETTSITFIDVLTPTGGEHFEINI